MSFINKRNITFQSVGIEWLNLKKLSVKHSTYVRYSNLLKIHIFPYYTNKSITKIDNSSITVFLTTKQKELSLNTMKILYYLIQAILKYAQKKYRVNIPYYKISFPISKSKIKILSKHDQLCLEKKAREIKGKIGIAVILGLYTGMRVGELCALKWEDIDFDKQVLYVRRTVQRIKSDDEIPKYKLLVSSPKSISSQREIPLMNSLYQYLKFNHTGNMDDYVLSGNKKITDPRQIQYQFKKMLKKCCLEDVNFHTLRHTFATNCVELDIDIKSLSEILGHSSVNITLNLYVHSSLEFKKNQMEKLNTLMKKST